MFERNEAHTDSESWEALEDVSHALEELGKPAVWPQLGSDTSWHKEVAAQQASAY